MLIVKPYGRSETARDAQRKNTRSIRLNREPDLTLPIAIFAKEHPELVIAQWISTIDKIAAKPFGNRLATPEQRKLRQSLGDAAYALLRAKTELPFADRPDLDRLWNAKLHPYGEKTREDPKARARGRWFARFAGSTDPAEVDADEVARKIYDHLYVGAFRISGDRPARRQGHVEARAHSIAGNTLKSLPAAPGETPAWSKADKRAYVQYGDVAALICGSAQRRCEEERKRQERKRWKKPAAERRREAFSMKDAAPILFEHYGRLFTDAEGRVLSIAEAREAQPGLFALHMAVKQTYTRLLKRHRKTSLAHVLPKNCKALLRLIERQSVNRDLNALVRLGKVIHYEASRKRVKDEAERGHGPQDGADTPDHIVSHWPAKVDDSFYWTSEGQAEIKRNEAFVRVWRHVIAMATRTLTDWADPEARQKHDVLGSQVIGKVTGGDFQDDRYSQKADLLFGSRAGLFIGKDEAFRKSVLKMVLTACADLRNHSFHFKGRGGFLKGLTGCAGNAEPQALAAARALWEQDRTDRSARLQAVMTGAHFDYFLEQPLLDAIARRLGEEAPALLPLPRFRRLLTRAEHAWRKGDFRLRLPAPGNREELERPVRLCQYTALKLLYERGFAAWLSARTTEQLKSWIDSAVTRTTKEARAINKDQRAVARAAGLIALKEGEGIAAFIDKLTAATATELRVQRGYASDADQARQQAKYLDDLRCDVVGQAFESYLIAGGFEPLLHIPLEREKPEAPLSQVPGVSFAIEGVARDWQVVLYVFCHLVPVDEIGKLLHQLRKWTLLEPEAPVTVEAVQTTFALYLDMHDAKFEGGYSLPGRDALKALFESDDLFAKLLPPRIEAETEAHVPLRGLRELLRFGNLKYLLPILENRKIETRDVETLEALEAVEDGTSKIARHQKDRQDLHETWVKKKQDFSGRSKTAYCEALKQVVQHRHLKAQVTLTNHVRLHRLLMTILGRLLDYAGLWERDLYFASLALAYLEGKVPADICSSDGLSKLLDGRIVEARRSFDDSFRRRLARYMPEEGRDIAIRNDLAHFNMLRGDKALDLTALVNKARRLMAYDRKLKNAVSQSVVELLRREGLDLCWTMSDDHDLTAARLRTRHAQHLGDKRILESLLGDAFVAMAASLFDGSVEATKNDVLSIDIARTFSRETSQNRGVPARKKRRPDRKKPGQKRGFSPRKTDVDK